MKKILSILFVLGLLLNGIFLVSCSGDEDPFIGTDNYITSFSLTKNGVTYKASVTENEVAVSIPKNIDFQGATVDYQLTELASISPDPAQIADWSKSYDFTVTSYNKSVRKYTYKPSFSEITEVGSVVVLTQSDVDKLASSNIEVIDGNLVIGANEGVVKDSIKNLNGLRNLKRVTNSILIYNTFGGENLDGLINLENAGGIYIKNLTTRKSTKDSLELSFPNLTEVGDFYVNSAILRKVLLPKLRSASSFYVNSQSLSEIEFPLLETVITDFAIESGTAFNSYATTTNKKLKVVSLKNLKEVLGSLSLRGLPALNVLDVPLLENIGFDFTVNVVALEKIEGPLLKSVKKSFSLKNVDALARLYFPKLTHMGAFEYDPVSNKQLLEFFDFSALERVDGDMKMSYLKMDLMDFPALKKVGNQLNIRFIESLTAINIPVLEECNNIYFYSLPLLTSLDLSKIKQLEKLELISCYKLSLVKGNNNMRNITLNGGSRLCDFTRFEGIESIPGTLIVTNYSQNGEFDFPGIKHIGRYEQSAGLSNGQSTITFSDLQTVGTLKLTSCSYLKKLIAPELITVTDLWDTSYMNHIQSGDIYVPKLTKIGTFKFYGGTYSGVARQMKLTDLNDFSSLKEIDAVDIKWWGQMTDFSGLKNIFPAITEVNWSVDGCGYNPTHQQMTESHWVKS